MLVQSGGVARRVRCAQSSHLVQVWRPGVLYRLRGAAGISANLAMDVIREEGSRRGGGCASRRGAPCEVWLAVIQKVFDCGCKTNEQLEGITTEQAVAVKTSAGGNGHEDIRFNIDQGVVAISLDTLLPHVLA